MFQRTTGRVGGIACGNEHDPKTAAQIVLVLPHNFPHAAPNTIANNCASDPSRSNKTYAARVRTLYWYHIEQ
jgi:hypothetical protein